MDQSINTLVTLVCRQNERLVRDLETAYGNYSKHLQTKFRLSTFALSPSPPLLVAASTPAPFALVYPFIHSSFIFVLSMERDCIIPAPAVVA